MNDAGLTATHHTTASVRLEKKTPPFSSPKSTDVTARVPGADASAFETAAGNAKAGCPVSRLFNAEITMDAKLEG